MSEDPSTFTDGLLSRFWARVNKTGSCWLWMGHRTKPGWYGRINWGGRNGHKILTHRLGWILANGPIPDGMRVLHLCDNPACVRPEHLEIGTQHVNIMDSVLKGRWTQGQPGGERHAMAYLTVSDVLAIRASSEKQAALAARFGVSRQTIGDIRSRRRWASI